MNRRIRASGPDPFPAEMVHVPSRSAVPTARTSLDPAACAEAEATGFGSSFQGGGFEADGLRSMQAWLADRARRPMPRDAILLHAPTAAFQAPGGGENQLLQTARFLEQFGRPVRPFCSWTDRLCDARLLHLFGMSREGLELARVARIRKLPVVLSPICWVDPRAILALTENPVRLAASVGTYTLRSLGLRRFGWRAELLSLCRAILPNSLAEAAQLVRLFGARPDRIHVVPNGVETRFAQADPGRFRASTGLTDPFVLYVGRVEPRKNVLGLIRAVRSLGHPIVVVGDTVPGHERYGEACRRAGRSLLRWIPRTDHADPLLASAYAAARVFALPSWFETPGLAALEAALAGCPVVITPHGCTREYFGDRVRYARPDRRREITSAVSAAWDEPGRAVELAHHVGSNYLWSEVARKTGEAYDRVVS